MNNSKGKGEEIAITVTTVLCVVNVLYYLWFSITSVAFTSIIQDSDHLEFQVVRHVAAIVACLLFVFAGSRGLARIGWADFAVGAISLFADLLVLVALPGEAESAATFFYAAITGFVDGWLVYRMGYINARYLRPHAAVVVTVIIVMGYLFGRLVFGSQVNGYAIVFASAIPLVCFLLLAMIQGRFAPFDYHLPGMRGDQLRFFLLPLVAGLLATAVHVGGVGDLWGSSTTAFGSQFLPVHLAVSLLFCGLLYGVAKLSIQGRRAFVIVPFALVLVSAISFVPHFEDVTVLAVGIDCFLEVMLCGLVAWSRFLFFFHCRERLAFFLAFQFLIMRLTTLLILVITPIAGRTALVVMALMLVGLYLVCVLFGEADSGRTDGNRALDDGENGIPTDAVEGMGPGAPEHRFEEIANHANLSKREQEISLLLLEGRNVPFIQKHLFISEGTVRTHITHIYKKLNVANRQEFIDVFRS